MKVVKIIFISMEILALTAVLVLSFSMNAEESLGHWLRAAFITLFALVAVTMQREQQAIEWDD